MAKVDLFSLGIKPHYTFDQLVVGVHNQMAAAASLQVAKNLGEAYNPLFIFGPTGVGKTHLMQGIAHSVLAQRPDIRLKYISAERFVNDVISAISEDNLVGFRQHYHQLDLLLLDDVHFLMESKSAQGEFLHVFNNLHQQNRQIVLTSDRSPHQLENFDKAIRSRLEWGLSADVKLPDPSTRMEILRLKQKNYGFNLSDEAMRYVAEILSSNVRELEGFLKRLHAYATLSHQPVTIGLIKSVVQEIQPNATVTLQSATAEVETPLKTTLLASQMETVPLTELHPSNEGYSTTVNQPIVQPPEPVKADVPVPLVPVLTSEKKVEQPEVSPIKIFEVPGSNGQEKPQLISISTPPQPPVAGTPPPIYSQAIPQEQLEPPLVAPKMTAPELTMAPSNPSLTPVILPKTQPIASEQTVIPPPPPSSAGVIAPKPPIKKPLIIPPLVTEIPPVSEGNGATKEEQKEAAPLSPSHPSIPVPIQAGASPEPEAISEIVLEDDFESEPLPSGHKEISVVFFYPAECEKQLNIVVKKFNEVIKKHKLKFRLKRVTNFGYEYKGKINYSMFVEVCKTNKVPVAIVIGPPSDGGLTDQEFYDLLSVTLDVQGVSLQLVTWNEIDKDYRYLNLSLDIALVKAR